MMRKRKVRLPYGWGESLLNRLKLLGKTGLSLLLALLIALGPVWPVLAAGTEITDKPADTGGLFDTVGAIFSAAGEFIREGQAAGRSIPEKELSEALDKLDEFNLLVLKDPRLAGIIDQIISDILTDEGVVEGIQSNKEFIADIIRDPRLVKVLGEIITDYLQDERMAQDIEDLFSIIFDLITQEDLHYFIRDALAALVENKALERTMNGLLLTATDMIYNAGSDSITTLLTDERVPLAIKELASVVVEPLPEIVTLLLVDQNNQRILSVAEDMLLILGQYGSELPLDLLEDERLREAVADIMLLLVDPTIYITGSAIGMDLTEHLLDQAAQGLIADDTIEDMLVDMTNDFFKAGMQGFCVNSLTTVISQARSRAVAATPADRAHLGQQAEIQKGIADAVAEVPPQIFKFGFFMWLVDGNPDPPYSQTPGLDPYPRTYTDWARDLGGLLKKDDRAVELAAAASADVRKIIDNYLLENRGNISDSLRAVIEELPLDEVADEIRNSGRDEELLQELVDRVIDTMPLEDIAETIVEEAKIGQVVEEISEEFVDELPFDQAAQLIKEDRRIKKAIKDTLPYVSLAEVANTIRYDDRIISALEEAASNLPVEKIIDFIQDDTRAGQIGQVISGMLLNLVADFVEDEQLATFLHGVVLDAVDSLGGSPGTLILDSMARFIENEDFTSYLINALYELVYGVNAELCHLYKQVVPRFFTQAIWRLI